MKFDLHNAMQCNGAMSFPRPGAKSQHSQCKFIWMVFNSIYLCHLCWWSHFVWLCLRIKKIWNVSQVTIGLQLHWSCRESPHFTDRPVCIKEFLAQAVSSEGKTCTQSLVSCCQIWAGHRLLAAQWGSHSTKHYWTPHWTNFTNALCHRQGQLWIMGSKLTKRGKLSPLVTVQVRVTDL